MLCYQHDTIEWGILMAFTKPMHNSEIIVARTIKQGLNPILLVMSIEDFPK